MIRVLIESPFKATDPITAIKYRQYLSKAIMHSLGKNEAPFASHGFYTYYLDDEVDEERRKGICAGFAWGEVADIIAVYADYGISYGMSAGILKWKSLGTPIVERLIGKM